MRVVPKAGARPSLRIDRQALNRYVAEHEDALAADVAHAKAAAMNAEVAGKAPIDMPLTNEAWLGWLEEHEAEFRELLRTAAAKRRALNVRWSWRIIFFLF